MPQKRPGKPVSVLVATKGGVENTRPIGAQEADLVEVVRLLFRRRGILGEIADSDERAKQRIVNREKPIADGLRR